MQQSSGDTHHNKISWDIEKPSYPASKHEGNWITLYKNNSSEFKYNSNTQKNQITYWLHIFIKKLFF